MTREEFMDIVYSELHSDDDNYRANRIIDAADEYAEKQTGWIPVSEGLPEVMDGTNGEYSDDVLICVEYDEQITISTGFYGYYPNSKSQQGWWSVWAYGCHQLDSKYKVVAWTPLPEPYKASPTGEEVVEND